MIRIISVTLLLLVFSCTSKKDNRFPISLSNPSEQYDLSIIASNIDKLQLETNKDCLIGSVDMIINDDTLLIVLDQSRKSILLFNDKGQFKHKIHRWGKGEGEYITIEAFCVDLKNDLMYAYDVELRKLLVFDYNGDFKYEAHVSDWLIRSIGVLDNGNLIAFTPDLCAPVRDGVWEMDPKGKFVKQFADVDPKYKLCWLPFPYYSSRDGIISYYDIYSDKVNVIRNDSLKCISHFKVEEKLPQQYFYTSTGVSKENATGKYYVADNFVEADSIFYITYRSHGQTPKDLHVFYNKETHNYNVSKKIVVGKNDDEEISKLFTSQKNSFIGLKKYKNESNPSLFFINLN